MGADHIPSSPRYAGRYMLDVAELVPGAHVPADVPVLREGIRIPVPPSRRAPIAGPPPGTFPSPVGASSLGVLAGPLGIPPPPCPPYASSEHPPYGVQLPRPIYFAGPPPRTPATSPAALPDLQRVPGESPGTCTCSPVPYRPLEGSIPSPPGMLPRVLRRLLDGTRRRLAQGGTSATFPPPFSPLPASPPGSTAPRTCSRCSSAPREAVRFTRYDAPDLRCDREPPIPRPCW